MLNNEQADTPNLAFKNPTNAGFIDMLTAAMRFYIYEGDFQTVKNYLNLDADGIVLNKGFFNVTNVGVAPIFRIANLSSSTIVANGGTITATLNTAGYNYVLILYHIDGINIRHSDALPYSAECTFSGWDGGWITKSAPNNGVITLKNSIPNNAVKVAAVIGIKLT